jgi:hypothetical protein
MVLAATFVMLILQAVYYRGMGKTDSGQSDLADVADGLMATHPDAEIYVVQRYGPNMIAVYGNELSIYMNRNVHFVDSVDQIPSSTDHPQVLVIVVSKRQPPRETPPGWTVLIAHKDANTKYVFLRLPHAAS